MAQSWVSGGAERETVRPDRDSSTDRDLELVRLRRNAQLEVLAFVGLGAVAFALRLAHLLALHRTPLGGLLIGDSAAYDAWARRLAAGDWIGGEVFYQSPLYPYLLGALYTVAGRDLLLVQVTQALFGTGACLCVAIAGRRLFGLAAGLAGGSLLAAFAPAIFFDGLIQKASLDLLLAAALVLLLTVTGRGSRRLLDVATGALLGLFVLNRENAFLLLPLVAGAIAWRAAPGAGRRRALLAFAGGAALVLAPVALRNLAVGGELHLTTAQLGPNLFIGNHSGALGSYEPLIAGRGDPAFERVDATRLAERASGRTLSPGEVSAYWRSRALAWIASSPGEWLRLTGRKLLLAWNGVEAMDTVDLATYAERSPLLAACARIVPFGVLAPLGLLGLWLTRQRARELWPLWGMLVVYTASVALFYVVARYRLPLAPVLALFAGAACVEVARAARAAALGRLAVAAAFVTVAAVLCNWPLLSPERMSGRTHANLGGAYAAEGRVAEAIAEYRLALERDPRSAAAHAGLGTLLARRGETTMALEQFEAALESAPDLAASHENLGTALASLGRRDEAIAEFRRALELDPESAGSHFDLGTALAASGESAEARRELELALRLEPTNAQAHNNLGILLASRGELEAAIREFAEALRLRPDFREAQANLERAEARTGSATSGFPVLRLRGGPPFA